MGNHGKLWWQSGIVYQIYPRSFQDSNQDGVGDLKGIISRLDYLNDGTKDSLGIDAIWLSPIYPSPMTDFGYDISDYKDIDSLFGSKHDFQELLAKAHQRGIKIILDLVINHTSDQHPWFLESRSSKENPKRDWYIWHPGKKGKAPNNWFSAFELQSAWWWDEKTQEFYLGTFTRQQPELNWRNPKLKEAMMDVIRYWLDMGVDGYRMDVVNWYIKDDQFRSNPWHIQWTPPDLQRHIYDRNRPETHEVCKEIRSVVNQYQDRMLVGEIYMENLESVEEVAKYYGNQDELHLAFNFAFLHQKWNAACFHKQIQRWEKSIPQGCWPNYTLSNHDQARHYSRYAKKGESHSRAKVAAALLLTLRGTPFLYYGEEIGMENAKISRDDLRDPLGVKAWPFLPGRDGARTPMQWDNTQYGGFSSSKPWLPVGNHDFSKTVQAQKDSPDSLLSFYRNLIWLRKSTPALHSGKYEPLIHSPKHCLAYRRFTQEQQICVVLNFSNQKQTIRLDFSDSPCQILFGTHRSPGEKMPTNIMEILPYEVLLLAKG
ncbi:MAG: DUF3459 domain-containing protein [Candidatus Brocadiae bacterium]|nr:DUF3459 domain-containing protein [Candidatus Brocadiia bacterium]